MSMGLVDCTLIRPGPASIVLGELPDNYCDVEARVIFNFCGSLPTEEPGLWLGNKIIMTFPLGDIERDDACPKPEDLTAFLNAAHGWAGREPTYWHCHAGVNRSAMMLAAYLFTFDHQGRSMKSIISMLRMMRGEWLLNNKAFERMLLAMDPPRPAGAEWKARRIALNTAVDLDTDPHPDGPPFIHRFSDAWSIGRHPHDVMFSPNGRTEPYGGEGMNWVEPVPELETDDPMVAMAAIEKALGLAES